MQPTNLYNIRDFGAVGDGNTDDTTAIQEAINSCSKNGGGRVLCPPGTYAITPLILRSGVDLHLEANALLQGSPHPKDYTDWDSEHFNAKCAPFNRKYLLLAEGQSDISITGKGTITGNGPAFYDSSWKIRDVALRPGRMIWFLRCRNVRIKNATFLDAPAWAFWVLGCDDVKFDNVTIEAPLQAINTDGIDIDCCRRVTITHCRITTGDDCIVLRSINRALTKTQFCEQIIVENCTLETSCNAVRLSYVRDGTIRDATFRNLTIINAKRGITCEIPLPRADRPVVAPNADNPDQIGISVPIVENILFQNISLQALLPIWFYLNDDAIAHRVSNIRFDNIHLKGSTPSVFKGNEKTPIENILLQNIRVTIKNDKIFWHGSEGLPQTAVAFIFSHTVNASLENIIIEGKNRAQSAAMPLCDFVKSKGVELRRLINRTQYPDRCG